MKLLLRTLIGGAAAAAAVVALAYAFRHDGLVSQARNAHESLTFELVMAFISCCAVLTVILAAAGSLIRWWRRRRPGALRSRAVSW